MVAMFRPPLHDRQKTNVSFKVLFVSTNFLQAISPFKVEHTCSLTQALQV